MRANVGRANGAWPCSSLLVGVLMAISCIGCNRVYRHTFIFEDGFYGPFVIREGDETTPKLGGDRSGLVVEIGRSGVVVVRPSDLKTLCESSITTYRFRNGTSIEEFIPHSTARTSGTTYVTLHGLRGTFDSKGQVGPLELTGSIDQAP